MILVTKTTTLDELFGDPTLVSKASAFTKTPQLAQPNEDFSSGIPYLYVGQGEVAYSYPSHPLALVSDDATTCCIIMLHEPSRFCLAHVDSPEQVQFLFDHWTSTLSRDPPTTRVYVVGGYDDEDGHGHDNVAAIVSALQRASHSFQVDLWVTGTLNTHPPDASSPHPLPRARGALCIGSASGCAVSSMDFAPETYRGPLFNHRMALSHRSPLHLLKTQPALECTLGPYHQPWLNLKASDVPILASWIHQATDRQFLDAWSTSPYAEGPKFVPDMKTRFQVCIDVLCDQGQVLHRTQVYAYDPATKTWVATQASAKS